MKKQSNFKLEEATKEQIKFLANTLGTSEAGVVELAVNSLHKDYKVNPYKETNDIYMYISTKITELENIRDYTEQWTDECEILHKSLLVMWESLRDLPTYWESKYLDDDFQVLDEQHEKNKPF